MMLLLLVLAPGVLGLSTTKHAVQESQYIQEDDMHEENDMREEVDETAGNAVEVQLNNPTALAEIGSFHTADGSKAGESTSLLKKSFRRSTTSCSYSHPNFVKSSLPRVGPKSWTCSKSAPICNKGECEMTAEQKKKRSGELDKQEAQKLESLPRWARPGRPELVVMQAWLADAKMNMVREGVQTNKLSSDVVTLFSESASNSTNRCPCVFEGENGPLGLAGSGVEKLYFTISGEAELQFSDGTRCADLNPKFHNPVLVIFSGNAIMIQAGNEGPRRISYNGKEGMRLSGVDLEYRYM